MYHCIIVAFVRSEIATEVGYEFVSEVVTSAEEGVRIHIEVVELIPN
jgi:hypothetical protein